MGLKTEFRFWLVYLAAIIFSMYVHELGHCVPAWANGYWAIPTPAKEYISETVPFVLQKYISLGGIIGSIAVSLTAIFVFLLKPGKFTSVVLAGSLVTPGMYTLRFIITGRGHDATEFQEAQSALGLNYSGHSLDWIFLILLLIGVGSWIFKTKISRKMLTKLAVGIVLTVFFVIGLQLINNAIFDPIFQSK